MTKTLSDLITIVRNRGDARNTNKFPDSYLTAEIQAAFAEGYELIAEMNSGFYDQFDNVTTTAHIGFVALPAGPPACWIVRAVDRLETNLEPVPMPRIGIKDRNRYGVTEGKPCAHRLSSRGIEMYPTPDAIYTIRVLNTPAAPTLDTTPREYYSSWEEYAVYGALVRLLNTQSRDPSQFQQLLAQTAARMIKAAGERDSSGPEYLNLREGLGGDGFEDDAWRRGF